MLYTLLISSSLLAAGLIPGSAGANTGEKLFDEDSSMKRILLNSKKYPNNYAIVDDEDYDKIIKMKWHPRPINKNIYALCIPKKYSNAIIMHRMIMGINDPKIKIDHINNNGLDNRKCTLRIANHYQNEWNRGKNINNTSNYKGVSYDKSRNKYKSLIGYNNKYYHLGRYNTAIEAAIAYNKAAKLMHKEFANINKI